MALVAKNLPANAGVDVRDSGPIPGSGKSPGIGNGNPPQYSCLENSMDKVAWQASPCSHKESDMTENRCACPHAQTHMQTHTHTHAHTPPTGAWKCGPGLVGGRELELTQLFCFFIFSPLIVLLGPFF